MHSRVHDSYYEDKIRDIISDNLRGQNLPSPAPLLKFVYLGSQRHAESLRLLRRLGIDNVLNCAAFRGPNDDPYKSPYHGLNINYHEFSAEDTDLYDISQHFNEAFAFINKVSSNGGTVLVHCAMGINRSAAVCVGYLIAHHNMKLLKAVQYVKSRSRVILSNPGFRRQLVWFARRKGMLDPVESEFRKKIKDEENLDKTITRYCDDYLYDHNNEIRRPPSGRAPKTSMKSLLPLVINPLEYTITPRRPVLLKDSFGSRSHENLDRNDYNAIKSNDPYEKTSTFSYERASRPTGRDSLRSRPRSLSLGRAELSPNVIKPLRVSKYPIYSDSPETTTFNTYNPIGSSRDSSRSRSKENFPSSYGRSGSISRLEGNVRPLQRTNSLTNLSLYGSDSNLKRYGSNSSLSDAKTANLSSRVRNLDFVGSSPPNVTSSSILPRANQFRIYEPLQKQYSSEALYQRRFSFPENTHGRLENLIGKLKDWPNRIKPDTLNNSLADRDVYEANIIVRRTKSTSPRYKRREIAFFDDSLRGSGNKRIKY